LLDSVPTVTTTEETLDDVVPDVQLHPVTISCVQMHLSTDSAEDVNPDINIVKVYGDSLLWEKMNKAMGNNFIIGTEPVGDLDLGRGTTMPLYSNSCRTSTSKFMVVLYLEVLIIVPHRQLVARFTNYSMKCLSHAVDMVTPAVMYGFIQDSVSDPTYAAAIIDSSKPNSIEVVLVIVEHMLALTPKVFDELAHR
jgi:hypothetical protein